MEAPIYLKGLARRGPTFREALLVHAVARLALHPWITNVQASWVKLGPDGAAAALRAGVNDLGGTLMNESISRAAGASHGQEMPPEQMEQTIRAAGRVPRQRTTLYGTPPAERVAASFGAPPLAEPLNPPVDTARLRRPATLVRPGLARRLTTPGSRASRRSTRSGRPHVVPICFAIDGDMLYTAVDEKPKRTRALQRLRNIEANPRVEVLIDHCDEDWSQLWWVRLRGTGADRRRSARRRAPRREVPAVRGASRRPAR